MFRELKTAGVAVLFAAAMATQAHSAPPQSSQERPAANPNERVCEDVVQVGSRLAKKRFCATRSEWEDKKRQDREATEKAQAMVCQTGENHPCQ